jgi:hypothetical protein
MKQLSEEWFAAKSGLPSASNAGKILTPGGKLSTQSEKYLNELLAERAGYGDNGTEPTEWMLRGIELELEARALFELETGINAYTVGGVTNMEQTAWCSPDALLGYESTTCDVAVPAGLEIKCPKASTHFAYLRDGGMPSFYAPQIHMSMAISGIPKWYFMSYFPGLDPLIILVERNEHTEKVKAALDDFCKRLAEESERFGL